MSACRCALGLIASVSLAAGCGSNAPDLPGQFVGSFLFNGNLVSTDDAGHGTTCLVDGGALFFPTSVQFYAQVSVVADAGQVVWQLASAAPEIVTGTLTDAGFSVATHSQALLSGCGCTAALVETIALTAPPGAGVGPGVSLLVGTIDDRLDPDPTQPPVCSATAGLGCEIGCDLLYAISGAPGRP